MIQKYILCFLLFAFSSETWAQLTCTNCIVTKPNGTAVGVGPGRDAIILDAPGTFLGSITLKGASNLIAKGGKDYHLSCLIKGIGPLFITILDAGADGHSSGIFLEGTDANTYSGRTSIISGSVICNKANRVVAIPEEVVMSPDSPDKSVHLWCLANNQLGVKTFINFQGGGGRSYFHLNGTTQGVAGLQGNDDHAVVENNQGAAFRPFGMRPNQVSANSATVNIWNTTTTSYVFSGGYIGNGNGSANPPLTVYVEEGRQDIQNPSSKIHDVTFSSNRWGGGGTLEFTGNAVGDYSFGTGVTFGGDGNILKKGPGTLVMNNVVIWKFDGDIAVREGTLRNGSNTIYRIANQINAASLYVRDLGDGSNLPIFDLYGNASTFDMLRGNGRVQNGWTSPTGATLSGGYSTLTIGHKTHISCIFEGIIQDNPTNAPVDGTSGRCGIALTKVGPGTQNLTGENTYTGATTVSSGTLRLQEEGCLGRGIYGGILDIRQSSAVETSAIFEHNGSQTQVFTGNITNTGTGSVLGTLLQSGTGKTIINGAKSFSGEVSITDGFLGGSGDLRNAKSVSVGADGSIGGGTGAVSNGGVLTVAGLKFLASSAKLIVTTRSATDNTPSLVEVKASGTTTTSDGTIEAAAGFTVDMGGDARLASGYVLKCSNGQTGSLPIPDFVRNNTGKAVRFKWDRTGLYMDVVPALTCNNCTFTKDGASVTGTPSKPAIILFFPETVFAGEITLKGDCDFTILGTGDYHLSGSIKGSGPLTYNAVNAGADGHGAGIFLEGTAANTYSGRTSIISGYVVCNKTAGVASVPEDVAIAPREANKSAHLWCVTNNQLDAKTVVDFSGAQGWAYFHLNGATQVVAGLQAQNHTGNVVVENNQGAAFRPFGMGAGQVSANAATLNLTGSIQTNYDFSGGYICHGNTNANTNPPPLTVNVTGFRQIIQNPSSKIHDVTFTLSSPPSSLGFHTNTAGAYSFGTGVTFGGEGTIIKTGEGTVAMNNSVVLKTGGSVMVHGGTLRNGGNTLYSNNNEVNKATLLVSTGYGSNSATFDLYGNASTFQGLIGNGYVQNGGSFTTGGFGGGYRTLTLGQGGQNNGPFSFDGVIRDNPDNAAVSVGAAGGIALKKAGSVTQVLTGANFYTGPTTVSSGTLKLGGNGRLGTVSAGDTYGGDIEISNVSAGTTSAIFEHNGSQTQVFTGNITNTGTGSVLGTLLQSGSGKTIINGAKRFSGEVSITGGFLGGSGDLRNAKSVSVGSNGSIGGGTGAASNGGVLTVAGLKFLASSAKLMVTTRSATDNTPSLVEVKASGTTSDGTIEAAAGFTVDMGGDARLASGYVLKCSNGQTDHLPLPNLVGNNTGKAVYFKWNNTGLYMDVVWRGLKCTNCTFTKDGTTVTGTPSDPAVILSFPETVFAGEITLKGDCDFTITGPGDYHLSGPIKGSGPLTYNAVNAGADGHGAGIFLEGTAANTYSGRTSIISGYVVCNKTAGVSVPEDVAIAPRDANKSAHLWCVTNNQLGGAKTVVDFSGAQGWAYFHLNGTTQSVAGLQAQNHTGNVVVENNQGAAFRPFGMGAGQVSANAATLNLTGSIQTNYDFSGGYICHGNTNANTNPPPLTVNVNSHGKCQVIQNPSSKIHDVTFTLSSPLSSLGFHTNTAGAYSFGTGVTFGGEGTIIKTGEGTVAMNNSVVLKTGGSVMVHGGTLRNGGNTLYSNNNEVNKATLLVSTGYGSNSATFDLYGNASTFQGLIGNGYVQNGGSFTTGGFGGGYRTLTLGQGGQNNGPFSFDGVIRDNPDNAAVSVGAAGGIALKKAGSVTQVLTGANLYTGPTTVSSGTLKLGGNGRLGTVSAGDTYGGDIEISNVSAGTTSSIFEHNGNQTQVFTGNITNTGTGSVLGTLLQSGSGKTIINGATAKDFSGEVSITGGFLGGSGDLRNAKSVSVGADGSIGGGTGAPSNGGVLTVAGLKFLASSAKLMVTTRSATDNTPSLVEVKASGTTSEGTIEAAAGFTVDMGGDDKLASGYVLKCSNGQNDHLPLPNLVGNNTGKAVYFKWNNTGLYMDVVWRGLKCTNCTFTKDGTTVTGTPSDPAVILSFPETVFAGEITLKGDCDFTITGPGDYHLSGPIKGSGPLTYNAVNAGADGHGAGIFLEGTAANTYSGRTSIISGYVVCNKTAGVSVPEDVAIAPRDANKSAHLWCVTNNQLGGAKTVVDFSGAQGWAYFHLNGTTQSVAGLVAEAHTGRVVVENNQGAAFRPFGMEAGQVSANAATLNISPNITRNYWFTDGYICNGNTTTAATTNPPPLTVNVTGFRQIIQNPSSKIHDVTFMSAANIWLYFISSDAATYSLGTGVVFGGDGLIVTQGPGTVALNNSLVLKTTGYLVVKEGTLRNGGNTLYRNNDAFNTALLHVYPPGVFDIYGNAPDLSGNASIFGALLGGGVVQNGWSSTNGSIGGGYRTLTLGRQNDKVYSFDGVIRDNPDNAAVSIGVAGKGGMGLKKVGSMTQVLTGANLYTGATTVSWGTLKLGGSGRLGTVGAGDTYGGDIEISNVPAGQAPAIFEHNGSQTQFFTGNITNTGTGSVLGTLLQSGTGKTIINGATAKGFSGNVSITGGFLGGSGDLRNAQSVSVESNGSIGGGTGVASNGGVLTVAGLKFLASSAKLIVTTRSATDNTPGLVEVKASGTTSDGTIEAAAGFTVDMGGDARLVSGYVLKCSNGLTDRLPLPNLVGKNTGKMARLHWDAAGLWIQIGVGEIRLSVSSVCPKGRNSSNQDITVTATYTEPRDLPPQGAVPSFSISDTRAISGAFSASARTGNTISATFSGANPTNADLNYKITYDDNKNSIVMSDIKIIIPQPTLSVRSGGNPNCKGTPMVLQAVGNGPAIISSANTNQAVVSNTTSALSATVTTRAVGNVDFWVTDKDGCKSDYLTVEVKDIPVMNSVATEDVLTVCRGYAQPPIPLQSVGTGDTKADAYNWRLKEGNNAYDVGLSDYVAQPPTETSMPGFTARNNTNSSQSREVIVTPYNRSTGCYGAPKDFKITVNPNPTITAGANSSKLCSGATIDNLISKDVLEGEWKITDAGGTENTIGTSIDAEGRVTAGTVNADRATEQDIRFESRLGGCTSNVIRVTINPKPTASIPDLVLCGNTPQAAITPTTGTGLRQATGYKWQQRGADVGEVGLADAPELKTAISAFTAVSTNVVVTRSMVIIPYNTATTCIGDAVSWKITVNPNPTITVGANSSKLCSGATIDNLISKNVLEGEWKITDAGGTENTIGTSIDAEGRVTAGTVNADRAAEQDIRFESRLGGCTSNVIRVTINPKPTASVPDLVLCGKTPQAAITPTTGTGLRQATGYKWQQRGADVGEVGLADAPELKTAISAFTAVSTNVVVTRSMVVIPYNTVTTCIGDAVSWKITVNPNATITVGANRDISKLCSGATIDNLISKDVLEGTWKITDAGGTENTIGTTIDAEGRVTAGMVNADRATEQDIRFESRLGGCTSNVIRVTINPKPTASIPDLVLCGKTPQAAITPTTGTGLRQATGYKWQQNGADVGEVGLPNSDNAPEWRTAISAFTAVSTNVVLTRSMVVIPYNVTTTCIGDAVSWKITVNPNATITAGNDISKLCSGALYANALAAGEVGRWAVYKNGATEAGLSTVTPTATGLDIQAATVSDKTVEDVVFTSNAFSCQSKISITIYPKPLMRDIQDMAYCGNSQIADFIPASDGNAEAKPTHFQWKLATSAANTAAIGLNDYTTDWTKTAISAFTSSTTSTSIRRDLTITGYNQTSGCTTESQEVTITINPGVTLTFESTSPICSGTETNILLSSSLSNTRYNWTVNNNNVDAQSRTASASPLIKQRLTNKGNSSETVTYSVTATFGSCSGVVSIPIEVSNVSSPTAAVAGGGEFCVNPDNDTYQTRLIPTASGTNVEWTYTSYFAEGQENHITGNTQKWTKGSLSEVRDNLALSGTDAEWVYYTFRPFVGCLGLPTQPIGVRLHPAPIAEAVFPMEVCSYSENHPTSTNIRLSSTLERVAYTWTVDRTNSPEVSGFSEPSREGAIVPTNNPTAAKADIDDALTLAETASAQPLEYRITPWRSGCPGRVIVAKIWVNPLPVVIPPRNREHCASVLVGTEELKGTNGANQFKWTGGSAVNLPDRLEFGQSLLPGYRTPDDEDLTAPVQVAIAAKNNKGCESASTAFFTILVKPKPALASEALLPLPPRVLCTGTTINKAATIKIGTTPPYSGTTYTWTATAIETGGTSRSDIRIIIKDDFHVALPYSENTEQTGDLSAMFVTNVGGEAKVIFSIKPFLNGCLGDTERIEVKVRGEDLMERTGSDNMTPGICSGSAVNIKVGNEGDRNTYTWKSADNSGNVRGMGNEQGENPTVISDILTLKNNRRGNVTYSIMPSRGNCDGRVTNYTIEVNPIPTIKVTPAVAFLCSGQKTDITLSTNLVEPESKEVAYSWQAIPNAMGAQSSAGTQTSFEQQTLISQNTGGSVTYAFTPWYIPADEKGRCQGQSATSTYTVSSPITASISNMTSEKVCLGDKIALKASPEGVRYQWMKNGVEMLGEVGNPYIVPTDKESNASYAVKTTNSCGSSISNAETINVTADAYFTEGTAAMDKTEGEINKPISFSYTGPEAEYSWDFSDNTGIATTRNTSHNYLKLGIYHPVLRVVKPRQAACRKTFTLPDLIIKETPDSPDDNPLNNSEGLSAFPVPANTTLTVQNNEGMQTIFIKDISGQTVADYEVNGRTAALSVANLAAGTYFLIITDSHGSKRFKIIVSH